MFNTLASLLLIRHHSRNACNVKNYIRHFVPICKILGCYCTQQILCCRNFWQYSEHIQSCIIQVVFICQITLFQIAAYYVILLPCLYCNFNCSKQVFWCIYLLISKMSHVNQFSLKFLTTRWINIVNASAWNFRVNFCPCQPLVSRDEGVFRALSDKVLNDTQSANMCLLNCWYETIKWA